MKKPKAYVTLVLARQDAIRVVEALRTHAHMQINKQFSGEAAVSTHLSESIKEVINS
jgi:hypothetical protein